MNQNMIGGKSSLVLPNIVAEDESDYVFVGGDVIDDIDDGRGGGGGGGRGLDDLLVLDGEEEWDEVSYDYDRCDLSPSLSCATSVATNVTLKDMNIVVSGDSGAARSSSSMDVDDDDDDEDDDDDTGGPTPMDTEDDDGDDGAKAGATSAHHPRNFPAPSANPKNGRRLSNKKLRRKMKMMKKAAAARALAEQKAAIAAAATASLSSSGATTSSGGTSLESIAASSDDGGVAETATSSPPPGNVARPGGSDGWASLAVACARESLMAYRVEVEAEKKEQLKKTRTVSISE